MSWGLQALGAGIVDNWVSLKGDAAVFVGPSADATESQGNPLRVQEPTRWLECLYCNQKITRTSDRVQVDGKHLHSFINPAGVIYRIGCFGSATGVVEVGEQSDVFTWFAGHVWRVALCVGCEQHLGWGFHAGESQFYGLVLAQLREPAC